MLHICRAIHSCSSDQLQHGSIVQTLLQALLDVMDAPLAPIDSPALLNGLVDAPVQRTPWLKLLQEIPFQTPTYKVTGQQAMQFMTWRVVELGPSRASGIWTEPSVS